MASDTGQRRGPGRLDVLLVAAGASRGRYLGSLAGLIAAPAAGFDRTCTLVSRVARLLPVLLEADRPESECMRHRYMRLWPAGASVETDFLVHGRFDSADAQQCCVGAAVLLSAMHEDE